MVEHETVGSKTAGKRGNYGNSLKSTRLTIFALGVFITFSHSLYYYVCQIYFSVLSLFKCQLKGTNSNSARLQRKEPPFTSYLWKSDIISNLKYK